jgi:hypothetical protein
MLLKLWIKLIIVWVRINITIKVMIKLIGLKRLYD